MMRYVNRRRLLIVVVLAALFGAVLPYGMFVVDFLIGSNGDNRFRFKHGNIGGFGQQSFLSEYVVVTWEWGVPTDEDWNWMMSECDDLIPAVVRSSPRHTYIGSLGVFQYGWPFRASHMCILGDPNVGELLNGSSSFAIGTTGWRWLDSHGLLYLPLGVMWTGVLGNVALSVLFISTTYCGFYIWRARRSIKRGRCYKCGYLSNGTAVCPECGTAT